MIFFFGSLQVFGGIHPGRRCRIRFHNDDDVAVHAARNPRTARAFPARVTIGRAIGAVDRLRHGSPLMESLIAENGLVVVGAEYDLSTGVVEFFES